MEKFKQILTKDFLYKEYITNKKSSHQIAQEVGCSHTTILRKAKKYNVSVRTLKEAKAGKNAVGYIDGRWSSPNYCIDCGKKISRHAKRCNKHANEFKWQQPEFRDKTVKSIFNSWNNSPNKPEKLLTKWLNKILSKQYKFVGDGKLIVNGFCPDFVNKNDNKIIEMFGDYWHNREDWKKRDKRRLIAYKKLGYKTLIIWEHELKDLDKVKNKILKFNKIGK